MRMETLRVVAVVMLLDRLLEAEFGVMEQVQEGVRVITQRGADAHKRLDVKTQNGGVRAMAELPRAALDNIPYLVTAGGQRLMFDIRAALSRQGTSFSPAARQIFSGTVSAVSRPTAEMPFAAGREPFPSSSSTASE